MTEIGAEISTSKKSVADYTLEIRGAWQRAAQSIIEVGQLLVSAEAELTPNEFRSLRRGLEDEGVLSQSTITKLMGIARNNVLVDPERVPLLPPSYEALYNLSRWDSGELQSAFSEGRIHPELQVKECRPPLSAAPAAVAGIARTVLFQVEATDTLKPATLKKLKEVVSSLSELQGIKVTIKTDF
jgi:hypothetical protein